MAERERCLIKKIRHGQLSFIGHLVRKGSAKKLVMGRGRLKGGSSKADQDWHFWRAWRRALDAM